MPSSELAKKIHEESNCAQEGNPVLRLNCNLVDFSDLQLLLSLLSLTLSRFPSANALLAVQDAIKGCG